MYFDIFDATLAIVAKIVKIREIPRKLILIQNFSEKIETFRKNSKTSDAFFFEIWRSERCKSMDSKGAKACTSCRSRQELSNEYFLATIGFDTAEN